MLAVAGGSPAVRGGYAEVSASSVVARAHARAHAARVIAAAGAVTPLALPRLRGARPLTPPFVIASLYLTHCSLLL